MKIIKGGIVVSGMDSRIMDIAVEGGKIVQIERDIIPSSSDEVIDAKGCLIFPGFIDTHTHFDMDNGKTVTADNFASGTAAAVRGGTTTIIDFATQDKRCSLKNALGLWHKKADGVCSCNYGFHMTITAWNRRTRDELPCMIENGVTSFKLYMAYDALKVDDWELMDILCEMKRVGGLLAVHCENGMLINALIKEQFKRGNVSPAAHPLSRPPEVEAEAISRLCYISRLAGWPVAVVHLSTELGLSEIQKARARGQMVIAETCPQYLFLTEEKYALPGFESAKYVCSPPLRKDSDRKALINAVHDRLIDIIATDHCSYNLHGQKSLGADDFSKIPNGLPGVEHRPALVYSHLFDWGAIVPELMCRLLSENPAKFYGMYPAKGALMVGSDADIVIFERGVWEKISAKTQIQNVDYTPFEGFEVIGCARTVLLGGETVVEKGEVVRRGLGRYVARERFAGL